MEKAQSSSSEDDATLSQTAARHVRDFLTKLEQNKSNKEESLWDAKTELEDLEKDLQPVLEKSNGLIYVVLFYGTKVSLSWIESNI